MPKTYLNPPALFSSRQYGFSQAVAAQGSTTLYISGQVGWDAQKRIIDPLDLGLQTRKTLENLETAVNAAGGRRTDIVSLRLYILDSHIHDAGPVCDALLDFFPKDKLPASTWIGVPSLSDKAFLIEIEAVAVLE